MPEACISCSEASVKGLLTESCGDAWAVGGGVCPMSVQPGTPHTGPSLGVVLPRLFQNSIAQPGLHGPIMDAGLRALKVVSTVAFSCFHSDVTSSALAAAAQDSV